MSNTTTNLSVLLNAPFPYAAYGVNYGRHPYIGVQWIVDRLNEVVGPLSWRHEFFDVNENIDDFSVELLGRLSIWDEVKQVWMERVNYGNDTMTILTEADYPTAQDRMDCKKSAVSDSLKKCAAWFGVASDVFKGFIDVIRDVKNDGTPNLIYSRLVATYGFIDQYGLHKHGIPILPDSYRAYYKEKGWEGVFQSDLNALFTGNRNNGESTEPGQSRSGTNSSQATSILPNENTGASAGKGATGSASRSSGNRGGGNGSAGGGSRGSTSNNSGSSSNANKPTPIRMKVLDAPKFNQDGSATFRAKLENNKDVTVFAGKELADEVRKIRPNLVVKSSGWYREDQQKVTLATRGGKIEVEAAA